MASALAERREQGWRDRVLGATPEHFHRAERDRECLQVSGERPPQVGHLQALARVPSAGDVDGDGNVRNPTLRHGFPDPLPFVRAARDVRIELALGAKKLPVRDAPEDGKCERGVFIDPLSRAERNQTKGQSKTLPPQPWG